MKKKKWWMTKASTNQVFSVSSGDIGPRQPPIEPAYVKTWKMGVLLPKIICFYSKNLILDTGT
jgi:hypothetical protein